MSKPRLNPDLLKKLAQKIGKSPQYLREQISRRAGRLGISSPAAQLVWAKEEGIGVTRFLNRLPGEVRAEVRSVQSPTSTHTSVYRAPSSASRRRQKKGGAITGATISSLLQDQQLRGRCKDLL